MTTDKRIPVPSFAEVLQDLLIVASLNPEVPYRLEYLNEEGEPHDLIGVTLALLNAPIREACAGTRPPLNPRRPGTPWKAVRFPILWERLFIAKNAMFIGMRTSRQTAENYLVYALLDHVADPQTRAGQPWTWPTQLIAGLKSFRRFLLSESSGFLVQTHGEWADLKEEVDSRTKIALDTLTAIYPQKAK